MATKKIDVYMGNCKCGGVVIQRQSAAKLKVIVCKKCGNVLTWKDLVGGKWDVNK